MKNLKLSPYPALSGQPNPESRDATQHSTSQVPEIRILSTWTSHRPRILNTRVRLP